MRTGFEQDRQALNFSRMSDLGLDIGSYGIAYGVQFSGGICLILHLDPYSHYIHPNPAGTNLEGFNLYGYRLAPLLQVIFQLVSRLDKLGVELAGFYTGTGRKEKRTYENPGQCPFIERGFQIINDHFYLLFI